MPKLAMFFPSYKFKGSSEPSSLGTAVAVAELASTSHRLLVTCEVVTYPVRDPPRPPCTRFAHCPASARTGCLFWLENPAESLQNPRTRSADRAPALSCAHPASARRAPHPPHVPGRPSLRAGRWWWRQCSPSAAFPSCRILQNERLLSASASRAGRCLDGSRGAAMGTTPADFASLLRAAERAGGLTMELWASLRLGSRARTRT